MDRDNMPKQERTDRGNILPEAPHLSGNKYVNVVRDILDPTNLPIEKKFFQGK